MLTLFDVHLAVLQLVVKQQQKSRCASPWVALPLRVIISVLKEQVGGKDVLFKNSYASERPWWNSAIDALAFSTEAIYSASDDLRESCTLSPSPQAYTDITPDTLYMQEAQTYFFLLSATAFLEASFIAPLRLFNSTFSIFTGLTRSCSDSHSRDNDQDPTLKTL